MPANEIPSKDGGRLSPFTPTFQMDTLFVAETEKAEQSQLFHLISIEIPGGDPVYSTLLEDSGHGVDDGSGHFYLHIVDSNHDVKYRGLTYTKFPVKFNGASISSDGSVDKASITVANVSREIMYYVEAYRGLRNMRVKVKTVFAKFLDEKYEFDVSGNLTVSSNSANANANAFIEDEYLIDNYAATEQTVTFQLDPIIDLDIRLPRRRFLVDGCYWKYQNSHTCKYNPSNPTWATYGSVNCTKNFAACKERQNEENFGGFPGISANRRIFL